MASFFIGLIVGVFLGMWGVSWVLKENLEDYPGYEETGLTLAEFEALTPKQKRAYNGSIILEDNE